MALSYNETGSKGAGDTISVPFPFLSRDHVQVLVDGEVVSESLWSWTSDSLLSCLSGFPSGTVTRVQRNTPLVELPSEQQGVGSFDFKGANDNDTTLLYIQQEVADLEFSRRNELDDLAADLASVQDAKEATEDFKEDSEQSAISSREARDAVLVRNPGDFANEDAVEAFLVGLDLYKVVGTTYRDTTEGVLKRWNGTIWEVLPDGTANAAQLSQTQVEDLENTTFGLVSPLRIGQALRGFLGGLSSNAIVIETTSGIWPKPEGLSALFVMVIAGGGGGGGIKGNNVDFGAASGGAAGGCSIGYYDANELGATETITIGAGGVGGSDAPGNGAAGGETRFTITNGSDIYATGGGGGFADTASATLSLRPANSAGRGFASNIGLNLRGGNGFPSSTLGPEASSGMGGSSILGGGGVAKTAGSGTPTAGDPGSSPGSGGSGAVTRGADGSAGAAGGLGANGIVILIEIFAAD